MAKDGQEIEVKTPISKADFLRIRKLLKNKQVKPKISIQKDTYYSPAEKQFLKPKYPYEWLSVRERSGKVKLNYKHWYPEGVRNTTHCDEYETEISDVKGLEKILLSLGYIKLVVVKKERLNFVKGEFDIALDKVDNLGYFIEIESLTNLSGVLETRRRILDFAGSLGVNKITHVPGGYGAAVMRKKGLMK